MVSDLKYIYVLSIRKDKVGELYKYCILIHTNHVLYLSSNKKNMTNNVVFCFDLIGEAARQLMKTSINTKFGQTYHSMTFLLGAE